MHDELRPTLFDMDPEPAAAPSRPPATTEFDDEPELLETVDRNAARPVARARRAKRGET